jgi:4-hydroxybenzoate polyprenyltransferase
VAPSRGPGPGSARAARQGAPWGYWARRHDFLALARLDKPVGILLLLWPTLWALWVAADGVPDLHLLVIFSLGVLLTRSAGCVINDFADRHWDRHVERTRNRPLTTGRITETEALVWCGVLVLPAAILVLFTNALTVGLAVVAAAVAATYPFMKRWTYLPQVVLGAAFGCSVPMAFAAQTGTVPTLAWLLFLANLLWTVAYDTWYAMVDREDDLQVGIRSTAILFGDADVAMIAVLDASALLALLFLGFRLDYGWPWFAGLLAASLLLLRQLYAGRSRTREACFANFLDNIRVGAVIFAGLAVDRALHGPATAPWLAP